MRAQPLTGLWQFSVALYGRPGVANALIGLQDRSGLDVNLVLYCLWRARSGRTTDSADIRAAVKLTRPWQSGTVEPLRAMRRALKERLATIDNRSLAASVARLREGIKRAELQAERIEHKMLGRLARTPGLPVSQATAAQAARANLGFYLRSLGRRAKAQDRAAFRHVIAAATSNKIIIFQ